MSSASFDVQGVAAASNPLVRGVPSSRHRPITVGNKGYDDQRVAAGRNFVTTVLLALLALAAPAAAQVITNDRYAFPVTEMRSATFYGVVGSIERPRSATGMYVALTIPLGGVVLHVFNADGKQTLIPVSGSRPHVFIPITDFGLAVEPVDGAVNWKLEVEGFTEGAGSAQP
jgi:hypothetical protein